MKENDIIFFHGSATSRLFFESPRLNHPFCVTPDILIAKDYEDKTGGDDRIYGVKLVPDFEKHTFVYTNPQHWDKLKQFLSDEVVETMKDKFISCKNWMYIARFLMLMYENNKMIVKNDYEFLFDEIGHLPTEKFGEFRSEDCSDNRRMFRALLFKWIQKAGFAMVADGNTSDEKNPSTPLVLNNEKFYEFMIFDGSIISSVTEWILDSHLISNITNYQDRTGKLITSELMEDLNEGDSSVDDLIDQLRSKDEDLFYESK